MSQLVSATELSALLDSPTPLRLLDIRFRLDKPDGKDDYLSGHIPGAVYVDLHTELAIVGEPSEGRHPVPSLEVLQAAAERWGINTGDVVVAYDGGFGAAAARAWWLLRDAGVDIRVLDGGYPAWVASGGAVETQNAAPEPGNVVLTDLGSRDITIDQAAEFPAYGVLLDVRTPERFRGETEPLDPVAGHIPGAVNLPMAIHLTADGMLEATEQLRANFASVGVTAGTSVAAYCGSGLTAAYAALALTEIGVDAQVFPGSWSAWSNSPDRPVATGR